MNDKSLGADFFLFLYDYKIDGTQLLKLYPRYYMCYTIQFMRVYVILTNS